MSASKIFHHPVTLVLMFLLGAGLIGAGEWMMGPARVSLGTEERKRIEQLSLLQTQQREVTTAERGGADRGRGDGGTDGGASFSGYGSLPSP